MGGVRAEIEHLLRESNIRNPGLLILFSQTHQCYCVGGTICSWVGNGCKNEMTWISFVTFIQ